MAVVTARAALRQKATRISKADAKPGDIALWVGPGNLQQIGIVTLNRGEAILTNSSSKGTFTWTDNDAGYAAYYKAETEYYRIK